MKIFVKKNRGFRIQADELSNALYGFATYVICISYRVHSYYLVLIKGKMFEVDNNVNFL